VQEEMGHHQSQLKEILERRRVVSIAIVSFAKFKKKQSKPKVCEL
jgi:hypothetical protein